MDSVQQILVAAASKYRGIGGCIAVVREGEVAGKHTWGFAHMDSRSPMTAQTLLPICSITKHMLCAVLHMLEHDHGGHDLRARLQARLDQLLPPELRSAQGGLTMAYLCDNQSGVRDYWAATVLCGARPEDPFSLEQSAPRMRDLLLKSLHFAPGSEYAYCNLNFYIVARLIEDVTGQLFSDLVQQRLFGPAGMLTASLPPAQQPPPPCIGYEGDEARGFLPAINGIEWSGDAGVVASLDDMAAYEQYIQRAWQDPASWYRAATAPHTFSDGKPATYRSGLKHDVLNGVSIFGHGGALRGFRLSRIHAPAEQLSVVAMFNHEGSAKEAAEFVMKAVLGLEEPEKPVFVAEPPAPEWFGTFLDGDTQLRLVVAKADASAPGKIKITYDRGSETIALTSSKTAESPTMKAEINGDTLRISRIEENRLLVAVRAAPCPDVMSQGLDSIQGKYKCAEIESEFVCSGQGGILYGVFNGILGQGPPHLMRQLGEDLWIMACPRGIDAQAPGDWTLVFRRNEAGELSGFTIGCWLARKLDYEMVR